MDIIYRYDPYQPIDCRKCETPEIAAEALREGNLRFGRMVEKVQAEVVSGGQSRPIVVISNPLSLGFPLVAGMAPVQHPFGIILGCSDARAPIERIFDHSHNELFVVRVAGNVLGTECLGSIEYAARHFAENLKLVVVLGHTGCGAVGAAVDLYLDPDAYGAIAETHALRSIVDRILVVVRVADKALERRCGLGRSNDPGYREALWQMAVYLNAALTAHDLSRELHASVADGMKVVYGVYNLVSQRGRPPRRIDLRPRADDLGRVRRAERSAGRLRPELWDSRKSRVLILGRREIFQARASCSILPSGIKTNCLRILPSYSIQTGSPA
jgi:carbonic anhydrase